MTTKMTHKIAMKLINDLGLNANYPIDYIIDFVNSRGGIILREDTLAELVEYNEIVNEARKFVDKKQEEALAEISAIGQELQSEDYNNKEVPVDGDEWIDGHKGIW